MAAFAFLLLPSALVAPSATQAWTSVPRPALVSSISPRMTVAEAMGRHTEDPYYYNGRQNGNSRYSNINNMRMRDGGMRERGMREHEMMMRDEMGMPHFDPRMASGSPGMAPGRGSMGDSYYYNGRSSAEDRSGRRGMRGGLHSGMRGSMGRGMPQSDLMGNGMDGARSQIGNRMHRNTQQRSKFGNMDTNGNFGDDRMNGFGTSRAMANGMQGAMDPRMQDRRMMDPRMQQDRRMMDPRMMDPRMMDPRAEDLHGMRVGGNRGGMRGSMEGMRFGQGGRDPF